MITVNPKASVSWGRQSSYIRGWNWGEGEETEIIISSRTVIQMFSLQLTDGELRDSYGLQLAL